MSAREHILIIRLGALGDIISCFQSFHEIRKAHPDAEIVFLTTPPFVSFARKMPWFDRVMIDPRPSAGHPDQWRQLVSDIKTFAPTRVYDLQGKLRQTVLYMLLGGPFGPEWSGRAPFCSHPRFDPPQPGMHFTEFVARQMRLVGVGEQPAADLSWLDGPTDEFALPERFAILVPGCSPHREYKRWPAQNFATFAQKLRDQGLGAVAIGTLHDVAAVSAIKALMPDIVDLSGRTDLFKLAGLMRRAEAVIGNDTGPVHMSAVLGTPTLTLICDRVDAEWVAPRGASSGWLQGKPLETLSVDEVLLALRALIDKNGNARAVPVKAAS